MTETFIDVAFYYGGQLYHERIDTSKIDPDHYDFVWDYWWGAGEDDPIPNLTFEATASKSIDGRFLIDDMYVNVYLDDGDYLIATIDNVLCKSSWTNRKSFI